MAGNRIWSPVPAHHPLCGGLGLGVALREHPRIPNEDARAGNGIEQNEDARMKTNFETNEDGFWV